MVRRVLVHEHRLSPETAVLPAVRIMWGGVRVLACLGNRRWAWPLYWVAQGTMFWALFVVGHDW